MTNNPYQNTPSERKSLFASLKDIIIILFLISLIIMNTYNSYRINEDVKFLHDLKQKIKYNDSIIQANNQIIIDIQKNQSKIDNIQYDINNIQKNIDKIKQGYEKSKNNASRGDIDSLYNVIKGILSKQ